MKTVRTVDLSEVGVVELEKPTVGAGEVLVRIKYIGFCGPSLNTFLGRNPMVKLPIIPGHEVGAVIGEIGPDVPTGFEKGMNITLNLYTSCGRYASCRDGRVSTCEHNGTLGAQRSGVMCGYAVLPWTKTIPAGNISSRDCALVGPMSIGFHVVSHAQVIDDEYVMVIGCGMVEIGAIVHAASRGATAIAVDLDDEKLILVKRVGASYTVSSKIENVHERMQEVTAGFRTGVMIGTVGSLVTHVVAMDEVGFTGRVACIGYTKKEVAFQTKYSVQKELDIRGSRNALPADLRAVINYMKESKCPVEELIPKIAKSKDTLEAMKEWATDPRKIFRILVEVQIIHFTKSTA